MLFPYYHPCYVLNKVEHNGSLCNILLYLDTRKYVLTLQDNMQYLSLEIDEEKNNEKNNGAIRDITGKNSKVKVLIIPTNEELVIARETVELL